MKCPRRVVVSCLVVSSLAGCGSATATRSLPRAIRGATTTARSAATGTRGGTTAATAPASCAATVASTLGEVAARIYHEAASGGDVSEAVHRVQSSGALVSAIDSGNAAAADSALRALQLDQIVRVEVLRGGRHGVFAQAGAGAAIAPVRGTIPGTSATFVLSTQSGHSFLEVVHQVTGAQVLLLAGTGPNARRVGGTIGGPPPTGVPAAGSFTYASVSFQTFTLSGAVYPSGHLRIVLLVPAAMISCPGTAAQTRVETLGHVGEHIYQEELHSPDVAKTVRHLESSVSFQRAAATHDAAAAEAAIVGFFKEHIHVVRVRVTTAAGPLVDVGGPYALAPVEGTLRSGGRVVGHFEMAIQDDAGYLKLARLFTGAEVLMRVGARQVMGTLSPGPATVPDRGEVSYRGRAYQAYSFTGVAFPSGPLRISLLLPS